MTTYGKSRQNEYDRYRSMFGLCGWIAFFAFCATAYFADNAFNGVNHVMYIAIHSSIAVLAFIILSAAIVVGIVNSRRLRRLEAQGYKPRPRQDR